MSEVIFALFPHDSDAVLFPDIQHVVHVHCLWPVRICGTLTEELHLLCGEDGEDVWTLIPDAIQEGYRVHIQTQSHLPSFTTT